MEKIVRSYDVTVVGAGPIGGFVAGRIAEKGFRVLLVEEHPTVGKPVQCAGLVSKKVFVFVPFAEKSILNRLSGVEIYIDTHTFKLKASETKAVVVDRKMFDLSVVEDALKKGADIMLYAKAVNFKRTQKKITIQVASNNRVITITTNILIGADGVRSEVARAFNLNRTKSFLSGFQADLAVANYEDDLETVKIFVGKNIAPNFFAWLIPITSFRIRVGLCTENTQQPAQQYFENLVNSERLRKILKGGSVLQYVAGGIPIGNVKNICTANVMLVGDAACHTKATSGGGLYYGLMGAKLCVETAIKSLQKNDFSKKALQEYAQNCAKTFGKELKNDLRIHKFYTALDNNNLRKIMEFLNRPSIKKLIEEKGDIDYHSKLAWELIKKDIRVLKFLPIFLRCKH